MGCNSGIYTTALASEALKPLDDLLAEYGQGIVDAEGRGTVGTGSGGWCSIWYSGNV